MTDVAKKLFLLGIRYVCYSPEDTYSCPVKIDLDLDKGNYLKYCSNVCPYYKHYDDCHKYLNDDLEKLREKKEILEAIEEL